MKGVCERITITEVLNCGVCFETIEDLSDLYPTLCCSFVLCLDCRTKLKKQSALECCQCKQPCDELIRSALKTYERNFEKQEMKFFQKICKKIEKLKIKKKIIVRRRIYMEALVQKFGVDEAFEKVQELDKDIKEKIRVRRLFIEDSFVEEPFIYKP